MDPPHADPFTPWLGPDDFELLRKLSGSATPTYSMPPSHFHFHTAESSSASSAHATASLHHGLSSIHSAGSSTGSSPPTSPSHKTAAADEALMSVDELRREKNRQKVRRHYYRKITHLNALRSEVEQLESKFQELVKQNETAHVETQRKDQLLDELTVSRTALEEENENLRRFVAAQHDRSAYLRDLLATEHELFMSTQMAKAIFIKPLSRAECNALQTQAINDVHLLTSSPRRTHEAMTGVAGWQADTHFEDDNWKYSFQKTFRDVSPSTFSDSSWSMMTDPTGYARLFSPTVDLKCVIVQRVDEHNVVLLQECRAMDANNEIVLLKSLFLVSRVATPTGEMVICRGLGEDRLQDRELFLPTSGEHSGKIVWQDLFSWTQFNRSGPHGEDCDVHFGGSTPPIGNTAPFWSVEILNVVVRWECAVHGTPLLLRNASE